MADQNLIAIQKMIKREVNPVNKLLMKVDKKLTKISKNPQIDPAELLSLKKDILIIKKNTLSWNKLNKLTRELLRTKQTLEKDVKKELEILNNKAFNLEFKLNQITYKLQPKPAES